MKIIDAYGVKVGPYNCKTGDVTRFYLAHENGTYSTIDVEKRLVEQFEWLDKRRALDKLLSLTPIIENNDYAMSTGAQN